MPCSCAGCAWRNVCACVCVCVFVCAGGSVIQASGAAADDAVWVRSTGMLQQLLDLGGPGASVEGVGSIPEIHGDFRCARPVDLVWSLVV